MANSTSLNTSFRPMPKVIRQKNPKTGLKRAGKVLSQGDPANFDRIALEAIYGPYPRCFVLPNRQAQDIHHCVGRGNPKDAEDRAIHSSVFNAIPLCREVHDGCPLLTSPGMRTALLNHARKHVMNAIGRRVYEWTENDRAFLEKYAVSYY